MKKLTDRVKEFFPFITNSMLSEAHPGSFDFIKSKQKMLQEFEYCLRHANLVGIYCPMLGNGMFLVGVENIVSADNGSATVIFFPHDMSGHMLSRRSLEVDDITMIVPFNNPYINPVVFRVEKVSLAS